MNISLPRALESFVRGKVKSGQYSSASEVVRDGLREMQAREEAVAEIREKVREGQEAMARGDYLTAEQFGAKMAKLKRELARRKKVSA